MTPAGPRVTIDRRFVAYGVRVGLRMNDDRAGLDDIDAAGAGVPLPPGWQADVAADRDGTAWYDISVTAPDSMPRLYRLDIGPEHVASGVNMAGIVRAFRRHAELLVAERAPEHLFVHAGVVGWHGRAVLLPGRSYAGKTTLVRACLAAGATYYSDEYAVLDRAGRVYPYARPLAVRGGPGEPNRHVPAETIGASVGRDSLPVGLVLVAVYRPGAQWRPLRLTPARALLALMDHTVAARGSPEHSMPILARTVAGAHALESLRGDVAAMEAGLVACLHTACRDPALSHEEQMAAHSD